MRIRRLRHNDHPDFNDVVVHFTGRPGGSYRPAEVAGLPSTERLLGILHDGQIRGTEMFGTRLQAVCFTECSRPGVEWLIRERGFEPCGIAFSKNFAFAQGAGPVLQVRGDDWPAVAELPPEVRARVVRLWPGADTDNDDESLPWWLSDESQWDIEREWRMPDLDGAGFKFDHGDVSFLLLPQGDEILNDLFDELGTVLPPYIQYSRSGELVRREGVRLRLPHDPTTSP